MGESLHEQRRKASSFEKLNFFSEQIQKLLDFLTDVLK